MLDRGDHMKHPVLSEELMNFWRVVADHLDLEGLEKVVKNYPALWFEAGARRNIKRLCETLNKIANRIDR